MIASVFRDRADADPDAVAFATDDDSITFRQAVGQLEEIRDELRTLKVSSVLIDGVSSPSVPLALAGASAAGVDAAIVNPEDGLETIEIQASTLAADAFFTNRDAPAPEPLGLLPLPTWSKRKSGVSDRSATPESDAETPGRLIVFTSGTTGPPKAAAYRWRKLVDQARLEKPSRGRPWVLAYPLNHFGGIQVLVHTLVNGLPLVMPADLSPSSVLNSIDIHKVKAISSTPTFWRMMLANTDPESLRLAPLERITLGGEAATGEILDRLRTLYPEAQISQVYAATEVGSCFSVRDGQPGFPVSFLERPVGNVELKVEDGELLVRSAAPMDGYVGTEDTIELDRQWYRTGDLVEVTGERVYFRGRTGNMINVGGRNVSPLPVEEVLLSHPAVVACRVYGRDNPLTGQIVAADVELERQADESTSERSLRAWCANALRDYQTPRLIRIVDHVETRNTKITRRNP